MSKYREEISQQEFEEIEKYITGRMDAAEQTAFERRIAGDKVLEDEVMLQLKLISTIESASFITDSKAEAKPDTPALSRSVSFWRYAAIVILVAGAALTGWWVYDSRKEKADKIYAAFFRVDPGLPTMMNNDTIAYHFNEGMILYKETFYKKAIDTWQAMAQQSGTTDTLDYYTGVAWLNMDSTSQAKFYLEKIAENTTSAFSEKAVWYLALIYTKEKNYKAARTLLSRIPDRKTAVELLQQLPD